MKNLTSDKLNEVTPAREYGDPNQLANPGSERFSIDHLTFRQWFKEASPIMKILATSIPAFSILNGLLLREAVDTFKDYKELRQNFSVAADTNRDGVTTLDEMISAYQDCGVQYDVSNPKRLGSEDMRGFIKRHPI